MGKTAQRKKTAFFEGFHDARRLGYMKWKKHPYMSEYRQGYRTGEMELKRKREDIQIESIEDL